ncbi:MAG: polysaccharide biosynthesis protein [Clostridia bacterium]|nr:polysaccharide biosynthesis protein [Clostridia bacterium]
MKKLNRRLLLVAYDVFILAFVDLFLLVLYKGVEDLSQAGMLIQALISFVCIFASRLIFGIYHQIWRYGGVQCYIRLFIADGCAFIVNLILELALPLEENITTARLLSIACMNLLIALAMRMLYRYAYKSSNNTVYGKAMRVLLRVFSGPNRPTSGVMADKTNLAIIGAGHVGVALAEELMNGDSYYVPRCFVDTNVEKTNRTVHGLPVFSEDPNVFLHLKEYGVQQVVIAIHDLGEGDKKRIYDFYSSAGYKVKVYDYLVMESAGGKRQLREFDIDDLLFRKPISIDNERTNEYYRSKVIMITGGGGSIGSELCRQIAKMKPKRIVIVDIYENGAYDVQQELRIQYGASLDVVIEIASITNRAAMERIFERHHPNIIINAAAHKHVPLMEHNCIEAVENNVFGTKLLVELTEEYGAERFLMVSTDKAVNPTNVMGATKRMCEMIVLSASTFGKAKYSATRFGNVLGSAGSVVPIFKKQIANGGPVTLTDKRIIRYFMTIPEASQLVLESGAMANNGELFVLDMGKPVRIYDLAESMIRLSGVKGVEIIETGLRPGEKLYEELLIKSEELDKTENSLIFIERDLPLSREEINEKLEKLSYAIKLDDDAVRETLKLVVPTFKSPNEINDKADIKARSEAVV